MLSSPPLPRRTDSLSSSIAKPKPTSPLHEATEDAKIARVVLGNAGEDDRAAELEEMLRRMTGWVEELSALLHQAYKNQTELETALTLTRSNLALALANNEMLEEALRRAGGGGKDVGWRRWSEREGVRRGGSNSTASLGERPNSVVEGCDSRPITPTPTPTPPHANQPPQSAPSRFFNFRSLQRISATASASGSNSTSPTATHPSSSLLPPIAIPSRAPSPQHGSGQSYQSNNSSQQHTPDSDKELSITDLQMEVVARREREEELAILLEQERAALERERKGREAERAALEIERKGREAAAREKTQLEEELESLSQALFEEANNMVSTANRKVAETEAALHRRLEEMEEELRTALAQREALKGALRIVEGENGVLRSGGKESLVHEITRDIDAQMSRSASSLAASSSKSTAHTSQVPSLKVTQVAPLTPRKRTGSPASVGGGSRGSSRSGSPSSSPSLSGGDPVLLLSPAALAARRHKNASSSKSGSQRAPSPPVRYLTRSPSPTRPASPNGPTRPVSPPASPTPPGSPSLSPASLSASPSPLEALPPSDSSLSSSDAPSFSSNALPSPSHPSGSTTLASPPSSHRWSRLPATPRSRLAVRGEFEDAMRRMRALVGEDGEQAGGDDKSEGPVELVREENGEGRVREESGGSEAEVEAVLGK